jgi:hypothetical protein
VNELARAENEQAGLSVANHYYGQRLALAEDRVVLERLIEAVGWTNDLLPFQWAQWYATVLAFQPDLIIELGRGHGNSTALFCQALNRLSAGRVESFCLSQEWDRQTKPRLQSWLPPKWFAPLTAHTANIVAIDFSRVVANAKRVIVLWDAHGFAVAEKVLGSLLPVLVDRPHLVLLHDISDARYHAGPAPGTDAADTPKSDAAGDYHGHRLWQGASWQQSSGSLRSRVRIGWMDSCQDQVIAVADFTSRNAIDLKSADHDYHEFFDQRPDLAVQMVDAVGASLFSTSAHWAYLQLSGDGRKVHFPPPPPTTRSGNLKRRLVSGLVRAVRSYY